MNKADTKTREILPEITIGMTGHVDHGKTTLTRALTGKWTMLHSEELKRGITIKLGYADADIRKCPKTGHLTPEKTCSEHKVETELIRKISFVDAPGHETLMAVMLSGAAIMDGALLVISAAEEVPQPQTAEHLFALKILGIENIIVVQNKIDLVTKETAIKNYEDIKKFVGETLGREVPIIPVSAQRMVNIDVLLQAIQEHFQTPERNTKEEPVMQVARSFDVNKPGTAIENMAGGVLGGAIARGIFRVGDKIEIKPGRKVERAGKTTWETVMTTVDSIHSGSVSVEEKGPGGSIALSTTLDPALAKADSLVGNIVSHPGKIGLPTFQLNLQAHLFPYVVGTKEKMKLEPFRQYEPLMINIGTATTVGVLQASGKILKLTLRRPVIAKKGDKAAIGRQVAGRWHLIGYGIIQ
jgi:translation initiation factor 2 subunit 3